MINFKEYKHITWHISHGWASVYTELPCYSSICCRSSLSSTPWQRGSDNYHSRDCAEKSNGFYFYDLNEKWYSYKTYWYYSHWYNRAFIFIFLSENNYSQIALKPASYFNSSPYINNIWTNTNMISCSSDIQCKKV